MGLFPIWSYSPKPILAVPLTFNDPLMTLFWPRGRPNYLIRCDPHAPCAHRYGCRPWRGGEATSQPGRQRRRWIDAARTPRRRRPLSGQPRCPGQAIPVCHTTKKRVRRERRGAGTSSWSEQWETPLRRVAMKGELTVAMDPLPCL